LISCLYIYVSFNWYIYISIGIKISNVSFSIGINVYKIFFNWYLLVSQNILFIFNWYHNLVSKMFWYVFAYMQAELNIFSLLFCFWVYICPFVDDWQKGGEIFVFYMHVYLCFSLVSSAYMSIDVNWYQEHHYMFMHSFDFKSIGIKRLYYLCIVLVSRALFCLWIVNWYREHHYMFMHSFDIKSIGIKRLYCLCIVLVSRALFCLWIVNWYQEFCFIYAYLYWAFIAYLYV